MNAENAHTSSGGSISIFAFLLVGVGIYLIYKYASDWQYGKRVLEVQKFTVGRYVIRLWVSEKKAVRTAYLSVADNEGKKRSALDTLYFDSDGLKAFDGLLAEMQQ